MSDKLDYLITVFDNHLADGKPILSAWMAALIDYECVYHSNDKSDLPNPVLARAATAELRRIQARDKIKP